jgi:hypothetical protein
LAWCWSTSGSCWRATAPLPSPCRLIGSSPQRSSRRSWRPACSPGAERRRGVAVALRRPSPGLDTEWTLGGSAPVQGGRAWPQCGQEGPDLQRPHAVSANPRPSADPQKAKRSNGAQVRCKRGPFATGRHVCAAASVRRVSANADAQTDCPNKKDLQMQAFCEAADGIRTHDLLHGKQ